MIMQLLTKKEERYMSWEEYKKRMIELQVINLIEKFVKQNSEFSYSDLDNLEVSSLKQIGGVRNERNIFGWI